ncbi:PREDICTED: transmembrane and coiled-coil domain-containing protein 4-like isoform X3 [Camelina sativa]|uniref:Transmembrane and coiled-coil domain-containing protein 4-like isoform X3 n=1 Tax=Camelina sativa TaxID=90675 RepID=A0ABM0XQT8_CAMSA|nr:PREDICTED: transmembrane and coiled-coil domain-containing protein 4-like isoform X3 [Camelina sativa]
MFSNIFNILDKCRLQFFIHLENETNSIWICKVFFVVSSISFVVDLVVEATSNMTPSQRYAASALFAIALNQAQISQTKPLGIPATTDHDGDDGESENRRESISSDGDIPISDDADLWVHEVSGLLRPVFRCLQIDSSAWHGLEKIAASSQAKDHIGAFVKLLSEDVSNDDDDSSEMVEKETALAKAAEAMDQNIRSSSVSVEAKMEKHVEFENECREKYSVPEAQSDAEVKETDSHGEDGKRDGVHKSGIVEQEKKPVEEVALLSHERKINVLYELLSACLADKYEENETCTRTRKGYDARHHVALRLLATWFDFQWIKMEAVETMSACSAMASQQSSGNKEEESLSPNSEWAKWKRGGIVGAAALTGGTLMAITGGLAAPAIAAGFGALAPTLGTIIPVIGASGFAAAAEAAGTVAGSVAVAASFGAAGAGLTETKMARRTGDIEEFEFKAIGENHNQGRLAVEILVAGFVLKEEDFVKPWEGLTSNLERYTVQWESKNIIAVSTAIQDWLTSRVAMELMRQGAMHTVLNSLLVAMVWPATLLVAADFIDSKRSIAIDRSDKAGKLLAEALRKGLQGNRPALVGFSLGARVVFKCLQTLAETEKNAEIVERVVLLGAPISIKNENWRDVRKMVAGRFINVYATNDWTLGVAFRASLLSQGLAGIQRVCIPGIEDVDVTDMVEGHSSYLWKTQQILERLELDNSYPVFRNTL